MAVAGWFGSGDGFFVWVFGRVIAAVVGLIAVGFVAVVIVLSITVRLSARFAAVDDHPNQLGIVIAEDLAGSLDQGSIVLFDSHGEQTAIDYARDDGWIRDC